MAVLSAGHHMECPVWKIKQEPLLVFFLLCFAFLYNICFLLVFFLCFINYEIVLLILIFPIFCNKKNKIAGKNEQNIKSDFPLFCSRWGICIWWAKRFVDRNSGRVFKSKTSFSLLSSLSLSFLLITPVTMRAKSRHWRRSRRVRWDSSSCSSFLLLPEPKKKKDGNYEITTTTNSMQTGKKKQEILISQKALS